MDELPSVDVVCGDAVLASWPLRGRADLSLLDELARLQLVARRAGWSVQLRRPSPELSRLVELAGLAHVLPGADPSIQMVGQPEDAEQPGVEEVVMPDDPPA